MNRHSFKNIVRFTTCLALACGASAAANEWELIRSTVDGGGVMRSTGGEFELSGTIGQPDAGVMQGGTFLLTGGFWFELVPTDCNEDGGVGFLDLRRLNECFTGPAEPVSPTCLCLDVDTSGTVDLRDAAVFQREFNDTTAQ